VYSLGTGGIKAVFLTTLKFLVGNRAAIFRIAESNSTIWLGLF